MNFKIYKKNNFEIYNVSIQVVIHATNSSMIYSHKIWPSSLITEDTLHCSQQNFPQLEMLCLMIVTDILQISFICCRSVWVTTTLLRARRVMLSLPTQFLSYIVTVRIPLEGRPHYNWRSDPGTEVAGNVYLRAIMSELVY